MGLRGAVLRRALDRPAVFLVTVPGATRVRLAVEAEVCRRRWRSAGSPAEADLLAVAGSPAAECASWLEELWRAVPLPRARVTVTEPAQVPLALDKGWRWLLEKPGKVIDVPHSRTDPPEKHSGHGHGNGHHGGGHANHGMDETALIAGLPMADRADDRDGLQLDRLHLSLGPSLADWPSGLVLQVALQGDVVQSVEVRHLPVPPEGIPFWSEPWQRAARGERVSRGAAARRRCAAHLDSMGRLLAVAGWSDTAAHARRLRDSVLAGVPSGAVRRDVQGLARRVERSSTLRWSIGGLGELSARRAHEAGVTGPAAVADGDAHGRLLVWLDEVAGAAHGFEDDRVLGREDAMGPRGRVDDNRTPSLALLTVLPGLLEGAEFAAARIILASLDPDIDELSGPRVSGGAMHE
ncbi:hypothetical protein [Streptomyces sp. NPDC053048]|uniref:hypothetical protein n=1 Tax=Streptomyces sp. NPDC053048 TaxID=3365694 RepID=UPI0037D31043